jgi:hypothetical protein
MNWEKLRKIKAVVSRCDKLQAEATDMKHEQAYRNGIYKATIFQIREILKGDN